MTKTFADKINDWKTAIEAKIGSMIEEHANDSTAHSNLFSDKSKVIFTRALNNGTRIGTLTIDGTSTDIFCETDTNTTYNTATASANGLMSKEDKVKLNNIDLDKIQDGATYVSIDDDLNLYIGYDPITDILLTSDKSVIQSGQTATLTSTAKNGNALLEGVPISFYAGNDYLGSAVTNSNGIGTFSYTGTGAGSKQITAKGGSVQSEPYSVLDCIFYDDGVSTPHNANWVNDGSLDVSYSDDGTTISSTSTTGSRFYRTKYNNSTDWRDSSANYQIELDFSYVKTTGSASHIGIGNKGIDFHILFSSADTGSGHLKILVNGNEAKYYFNDETNPRATTTMIDSKGLYLFVYKNASITFKNLEIYPI